jgi:hypothetical protein
MERHVKAKRCTPDLDMSPVGSAWRSRMPEVRNDGVRISHDVAGEGLQQARGFRQ